MMQRINNIVRRAQVQPDGPAQPEGQAQPQGPAQDPRQNLQQALRELKEMPGSPRQARANEALVAFSSSPATCADAVAVTHQVLVSGVGSMFTYGGGRNLANIAVDKVIENSGIDPSIARAGLSGVMKTVVGSGAAGAGAYLNQVAGTPSLNLAFPNQSEPVPLNAVFPDSRKRKINNLLPGAGDKIFDGIEKKQKTAVASDNPIYVKAGQAAFTALATVSPIMVAAAGGSDAAKTTISAAAPAVAGFFLGGAIGVNKITNKAPVPTEESVDALIAALTPAGGLEPTPATQDQIDALRKQDINLFISRDLSTQDRVDKNTKAGEGRPSTISGAAQSWVNKSRSIGGATLTTNIIQSLGGEAARGQPDPANALAATSFSNGAGMGVAIADIFGDAKNVAVKDVAIREREDRARELLNPVAPHGNQA
jgi:hypothetical protein